MMEQQKPFWKDEACQEKDFNKYFITVCRSVYSGEGNPIKVVSITKWQKDASGGETSC